MKQAFFWSSIIFIFCTCTPNLSEVEDIDTVEYFKRGESYYGKSYLANSFKTFDTLVNHLDGIPLLQRDSTKRMNHLVSLLYIGDIYERLGNEKKAFDLYSLCDQQAKKYRLENFQIEAAAALAFLAKEDEDALRIINKALASFELNSQNEYSINNLKQQLSVLMAKKGNFFEAKNIINNLYKNKIYDKEKTAKTKATLQRWLGKIYSIEGDYGTALVHYKTSIDLNTELSMQKGEVYLLIAENYLKLKRYEDAKINIAKAKLLIGDDLKLEKELHELYIDVYEATGACELGLSALTKLREIDNTLINENNKIQGFISNKLANENLKSSNKLITARIKYISGIAILLLMLFALLHFYKQIRNRKEKLELEISKEKLEVKNKELEVKNKELELAAINKVIDAQQKKEIEFAEVLHDNVGANLSALNMFLSTLQKDIPARKYNHLSKVLFHTINEARELSHSLEPPALKGDGLISAIVEKADDFNCDKLTIEVNSPIEYVALEDNVARSLYHAILEFMNNTMKYAEASKIQINFATPNKETLAIKVMDNGKGFDTNNIKQSKGLGLNSIKSRINYFNGSFDIQSSNKGTIINILVPTKVALRQSA